MNKSSLLVISLSQYHCLEARIAVFMLKTLDVSVEINHESLNLKSLLKYRMEDRKTEFGEFVYVFIVISHRITSNVFIDARRTTVKQIIKNSS